MPTSTLTSLAILKVNIDDNMDYLDYLRPFILQVLAEQDFFPITISQVERKIHQRFGLVIPQRTVEIVLRRVTRDPRGFLERRDRQYHRVNEIPDPGLIAKQADVERHINSVISGLREFSRATHNPITTDDDAINAICSFLEDFDIACLRTDLRGTALPELTDTLPTNAILVGTYVEHIWRVSPERFNSFSSLVQGHMLANALTCPDLKDAPRLYRNVTFYFDTPLLIQLLGYEGTRKHEAAKELIALVTKNGGVIAAFEHSVEEVRTVLNGAANSLRRGDWDVPRSGVVVHARRGGISASDLQLSINRVDTRLLDGGITRLDSQRPSHSWLSAELRDFEHVLDQTVPYRSDASRELDIHSVSTIYGLRDKRPVRTIEESKAVLVTSNSALADAAAKFAAKPSVPGRIPSVITDFALANSAWLKSPMDSSQIPRTQLLALSYAALQPSPSLLKRYLDQIGKLETSGDMDVRDLQLLRDSPLAYDELVQYSLGVEESVTPEVVTSIRDNIYERIRSDEAEKIREQEAERRQEEQFSYRSRIDVEYQRELAKHQSQHREQMRGIKKDLELVKRERDEAVAMIESEGRRRYERLARRRIWITDILIGMLLVGTVGVVELSDVFGIDLLHVRPWLRGLYGICTVVSVFGPARKLIHEKSIKSWHDSRVAKQIERLLEREGTP